MTSMTFLLRYWSTCCLVGSIAYDKLQYPRSLCQSLILIGVYWIRKYRMSSHLRLNWAGVSLVCASTADSNQSGAVSSARRPTASSASTDWTAGVAMATRRPNGKLAVDCCWMKITGAILRRKPRHHSIIIKQAETGGRFSPFLDSLGAGGVLSDRGTMKDTRWVTVPPRQLLLPLSALLPEPERWPPRGGVALS